MASRVKRSVPVTVNDVLDGHVKLDLQCLDRPSDVVAVVRTWDKAAALAAAGVQVREADYSRPQTLGTAPAGVDRLAQHLTRAVIDRRDVSIAAARPATSAGGASAPSGPIWRSLRCPGVVPYPGPGQGLAHNAHLFPPNAQSP